MATGQQADFNLAILVYLMSLVILVILVNLVYLMSLVILVILVNLVYLMNLVNLVNPPEAGEQADFTHQFGQVEKQVTLLPNVSTELEGKLVATNTTNSHFSASPAEWQISQIWQMFEYWKVGVKSEGEQAVSWG